eukprot:6251190-Heterocapsa_arctica.AAC.1
MEGRGNTPKGISSTWPAKTMRKHNQNHNPRGQGPLGRRRRRRCSVFCCVRPCSRNPLLRVIARVPRLVASRFV